jgi:hypothetical protein
VLPDTVFEPGLLELFKLVPLPIAESLFALRGAFTVMGGVNARHATRQSPCNVGRESQLGDMGTLYVGHVSPLLDTVKLPNL